MDIYGFLDTHDITYERYDHPAVYTCEEAERLVPPLSAAKTKNIFLRDRKGKRHFLVVVGYEKVVDLKALAALLDVPKLSLGSAQRLERYLGVEAGAVTMLGLVNDSGCEVELIVDRKLWAAKTFRCHPLVNTATLSISKEGLERFFEITGHEVRTLEVPERQ